MNSRWWCSWQECEWSRQRCGEAGGAEKGPATQWSQISNSEIRLDTQHAHAESSDNLLFFGQLLNALCYKSLSLLLGLCVRVCARGCAVSEVCGGVRTCPPTGRGSCRATAQTAACGRGCGEPSWCYSVAGGD